MLLLTKKSDPVSLILEYKLINIEKKVRMHCKISVNVSLPKLIIISLYTKYGRYLNSLKNEPIMSKQKLKVIEIFSKIDM